MRREHRPLDFLGIGAPKAGTTSLFHYLRKHPQVYLPPGKELPFFCHDDRMKEGWPAFSAKHFGDASTTSLVGKITPQYMGDLRVPLRIRERMPEVRLVALLRNPVERAFSDWKMRRRAGHETRDFARAVSEQLDHNALTRARAYRYGAFHPRELYLVRSEYGRLLNEYLRHFPRSQLLILFSEDLARDPQGTLDTVLSFIGLKPGYHPEDLGRRYHKTGKSIRFRNIARRLRKVSTLRRIWSYIPHDARAGIKDRLFELRQVEGASPDRLRIRVREKLTHFYEDDVRLLEELFGLKVPWSDFALVR